MFCVLDRDRRTTWNLDCEVEQERERDQNLLPDQTMTSSWQRIQNLIAADVLGLVSVSHLLQNLVDDVVVVVDDDVVVGCWADEAQIAGTDEAEMAELVELQRR